MTPILQWRVSGISPKREWKLMVCIGEEKPRIVASVWENGTWHTWDQNGTGGENSSETTWIQAKVEAAASAIEQGFV